MRDVMAVTQAPVMFSHTAAYGVAQHLRNVPDDVLLQVAANRGVVMVAFFKRFLTNTGRDVTVDDVADHIWHIVKVTGS